MEPSAQNVTVGNTPAIPVDEQALGSGPGIAVLIASLAAFAGGVLLIRAGESAPSGPAWLSWWLGASVSRGSRPSSPGRCG